MTRVWLDIGPCLPGAITAHPTWPPRAACPPARPRTGNRSRTAAMVPAVGRSAGRLTAGPVSSRTSARANASPPHSASSAPPAQQGPRRRDVSEPLRRPPARPHAWPAGRFTGLRTRGGFEITSLSWSAGKLTEATILAKIGGSLRGRARLPLARPAGAALVAASRKNPHPLFVTRPAPPAQLSSPAAKPPPSAPPKEFAYDVVTRPGETLTFRAAP